MILEYIQIQNYIHKNEFGYTNGYPIGRQDKNNLNGEGIDEHKRLFIDSYCYVYTRLRRISRMYQPPFL